VLEPEPSGLDLSPVTTTSIVLTGAPGTRTEDGEHTIVCAGSPMAVRSYRLLRRFRYEFSVPDVKLPKAGWSE